MRGRVGPVNLLILLARSDRFEPPTDMRLTEQNVARIKLKPGQSEIRVFDDEVPGLGCGFAVAARKRGSSSTASVP
jgi:hypothetical protein